MIRFIIGNWKFLALVLVAIVDVVLMIIPRKKVDPSINNVLAQLPGIVSYVESTEGAGNGKKKKELVIFMALRLYQKLTGIELSNDSSLGRKIGDAIERILETPQKKER